MGKRIELIADAMTSRSSKDNTYILVYLETERLRAEERLQMENESRRAEERYRIREENRRSYDQRFQMQMMMMMNLMNTNRQHYHSPFDAQNHTPTTVNSVETSQDMQCEFDGQDIIESELLRRTSGVISFLIFLVQIDLELILSSKMFRPDLDRSKRI